MTPQRTWDIAHTFGHLSFKLLATAQNNHQNYCGLKEEEKKLRKNVWDENKGWTNVDLMLIQKIDLIQEKYFESISCSIVLFQVMMEAIINDMINNQPILSSNTEREFGPKWKTSLTLVNKSQANIDVYLDKVYRPCRNTIIHPTQSKLDNNQLEDLNIIHFEKIKNSIKSGWLAYAELSDGVGLPHTKESHHNDSWDTMCEVNGVK